MTYPVTATGVAAGFRRSAPSFTASRTALTARPVTTVAVATAAGLRDNTATRSRRTASSCRSPEEAR
jgi:hypothetical protein